MKIHISPARELSEVRLLSSLDVDVIGFELDPTSLDSISFEEAMELVKWVQGVDFGAKLTARSQEEINHFVQELGLSYVYLEKEMKEISTGRTLLLDKDYEVKELNEDIEGKETVVILLEEDFSGDHDSFIALEERIAELRAKK